MIAILLISTSFVFCSCSPVQVQKDSYPTKYPNTPTMGDADRAGAL
jgi:hypothetical protein